MVYGAHPIWLLWAYMGLWCGAAYHRRRAAPNIKTHSRDQFTWEPPRSAARQYVPTRRALDGFCASTLHPLYNGR
jgi:hypothetical protein